VVLGCRDDTQSSGWDSKTAYGKVEVRKVGCGVAVIWLGGLRDHDDHDMWIAMSDCLVKMYRFQSDICQILHLRTSAKVV
jgi:hypothetical protein